MPAASFNSKVLSNEQLCSNIYYMRTAWNPSTPAPKAGQFYMLRAWAADEAPVLSRPISLHLFDEKTQTLGFLYEVKGKGTEKFAALKPDDTLSLTGPSGNGFPMEKLSGNVAVVGGGIGTAPLYQLVRELCAKGVNADFYAGFRDETYRLDAFEKPCQGVHVATDTGSHGHKGFVTDLLDASKYDAVCVCGPEIMMEKTAKMAMAAGVPVYVSKEAVMACGVGACLGCTCKTKDGLAGVCKTGPIFEGSVLYG